MSSYDRNNPSNFKLEQEVDGLPPEYKEKKMTLEQLNQAQEAFKALRFRLTDDEQSQRVKKAFEIFNASPEMGTLLYFQDEVKTFLRGF